ncbi:hypothetical protein [Methyloceanibacter sp.]|uniref:hypothetical protein n=1 Tax=Methyloceanibacter sp. TaxID=1965321 RepID=UPI003D6D1979
MLTSLIVAVGFPIAAVAANTVVRWAFGLPQSAAADLILVLIVFDLTLLIVPGDILSALPDYVRPLYGIIALGCITLWVVSLYRIEVPLRERMTADGRTFLNYPYLLNLSAYGLSVTAMIMNLAPLMVRP